MCAGAFVGMVKVDEVRSMLESELAAGEAEADVCDDVDAAPEVIAGDDEEEVAVDGLD